MPRAKSTSGISCNDSADGSVLEAASLKCLSLCLRRFARTDDAKPRAAFDVYNGQQTRQPAQTDSPELVRMAFISEQNVARIGKSRRRLFERDAVLGQIRRCFRIVPLEVSIDDRCHCI